MNIRIPAFLLMASCLAATVPALAEPLPMVYEAVTLSSTSGPAPVAVIPRSIALSAAQGRTPEPQAVQRIFETMKARFPAAYGTATLSITGGRDPQATLNLDQSRSENWGLVMAEVFYTLKSFGFNLITAPLYSNEPLGPAAIDAVVLIPAQPWFKATADEYPATMVVALDANRMLSLETFRQALATGNPEIMKIIQDGMNSPIEAVRVAAIKAMGRRPSQDFAARLPALLKDRSASVRIAVLDLAASGRVTIPLEDLRRAADSDPDPELRLAAAKVLAAAGVHDYDHILEVRNLKGGNPSEMAAALRRLKSSGKSDIAPAVAETLTTADETVRNLAVEVLAAMKAAAVMSRSIANPAVAARQKGALAENLLKFCPSDEAALYWLASEGSLDQASLALVSACRTTDAPVFPQVQCAKSADNLTILTVCTRRPEQALKERAVQCLADRTDQATLDVLIPLIPDPKMGLLAGAATAKVLSRQPQQVLLAIISGRGVPPARATRQIRLLALEALATQADSGNLEPAALNVLKGLMKDGDIEIRRAAVGAMARSRDQGVASLVIEGIDDPDEGIRKAAVVAAGRIAGPQSEKVIRKSLEDVSTQVRAAGLEILAEKPLPDTRQRLQILAGNARPEIRRPAVMAFLKTLGPEDDTVRNSFVSTLLYDQSEDIRIIAVKSMEDMSDQQSVRSVGSLVIDPSVKVRVEVARVLGRMRSDAALVTLKKMSADGAAQVRAMVVESLARFPVEGSSPILRDMLTVEKDADVRKLIGTTLSR